MVSEKRWHMAFQHGRKLAALQQENRVRLRFRARDRSRPTQARSRIAPTISHQQTSAKGETETDSDRYLNPIVTHRSTLIRYPAATMTRAEELRWHE